MSKTILSTDKEKFLINGKLVYSELENEKSHGLLMNARFIQGIFDDKIDKTRFNRFGKIFSADEQSDNLIKSLPEWYAHGLRAITVGVQGGGSCFTITNDTVNNSPYSADGKSVDEVYLDRLERIIKACDEIGMVVIVSYFYGMQAVRLVDDNAVMEATKFMSNWLRDKKFTNVIIEIANEHNATPFKAHPILFLNSGVVELIEIAKRESGGMLVGCSPTGGRFDKEITEVSTVILIHGNGATRHQYYKLINKCKATRPDTPIVCNEDSQAITRLDVAMKTGTSWGYYNNTTKQEPPTDWSITKGEDFFFAKRMAKTLGIEIEEIPFEEQFYLQGFEENTSWDGKRWIRLASFAPEQIYFVDFYVDGELYETVYDEPFTINFNFTWSQGYVEGEILNKEWVAEIHLIDGRVIKVSK